MATNLFDNLNQNPFILKNKTFITFKDESFETLKYYPEFINLTPEKIIENNKHL